MSICLICQKEFVTNRAQGIHLIKTHKMNKLEYVKHYILHDQIPLCECGCGKEIKIVHYEPYIVRKFLAGHNAIGENNPMYGKHFSEETKKKQSNSAYKRMAIQLEENDGKLPMHSVEGIRKRADIWINKFHDKIQKEYNITVLTFSKKYKGRSIQAWYRIKCNECKYEWEQFHQGYFKCIICHPRVRSHYEEDMFKWLYQILPDIQIDRNVRGIVENMELDFYIPSKKIAIEFNGIFWHSEKNGNKSSTYHLNKLKQCNAQEIHLIQLWESEWIKNEILVKKKLERILGIFNGTKINARDCEIDSNVSKEETNEFLIKHHIQGKDNAPVRFGLRYNSQLVAIMTFSKQGASRGVYSNLEGSFELSRFAVDSDISVRGAGSRLLTAFIRQYYPKKIITYADRRWSGSNNMYEKLGFVFSKETAPSYYYFKLNDRSLRLFHRFNFTKKKTILLGGDPNKTEWQNMQEMGYDRIWDCGTFRYEWNLK